jgi:PKD repeat protein
MLVKFLYAIPVLLPALTSVAVADWHQPQADYRLVIERNADSLSPVGVVRFEVQSASGDDHRYAVFDETGKQVEAKVLSQRRAHKRILLFNTQGNSQKFFIYAGKHVKAKLDKWSPTAGVVLTTKRFSHSPTVNSLKEMKSLWASSEPEDASVVSQVFHGINPHGASSDLCSHFVGWLKVDEPGTYEFGSLAKDASFLLLNGEVVDSEPGRHKVDRAPYKRKRDSFELKPDTLYKLEMYNACTGSGFAASAAWRRLEPEDVALWQRLQKNPKKNRPPENEIREMTKRMTFMPIPPEHFEPVSHFSVQAVETKRGMDVTAMRWNYTGQSIDHGLVWASINFKTIHLPEGADAVWKFDDGTSMTGESVIKTFTRAGIRTITLEVSVNGKKSTTTRSIDVGQNHSLGYVWKDDVYAAQKDHFMEADLSKMADEDFKALVMMAAREKSFELLEDISEVIEARRESFDDVELLRLLANVSMDGEFSKYEWAEFFAARALALDRDASAERRAAWETEYAEVLLRYRMKPDAALAVLKAAPTAGEVREVPWFTERPPDGGKNFGNWNYAAPAKVGAYSGDEARGMVHVKGLDQHGFFHSTNRMALHPGDKIYSYCYLSSEKPPTGISIGLNQGGMLYRGYWGRALPDDVAGAPPARRLGDLPATGKWVRLEVDPTRLGLGAAPILKGVRFAQLDGAVLYDDLGVLSRCDQSLSQISLPLLRKRQTIVADARLMKGDLAAARAYVDALVGAGVPKKSKKSPSWLRAQRNLFVAYVRDGDLSSARDVLQLIDANFPDERMKPATGLAIVRLSKKGKAFVPALAHATLLVNTPMMDRYKAEVLYEIIDLHLKLENKEAAQRTLQRLVGEYPLSEHAARAKERWVAN